LKKILKIKSKPRIHLGLLVEMGILKPGITFLNNKKNITLK